MYYYSNVESGETCVRASQAAAPRPRPSDHMFGGEALTGRSLAHCESRTRRRRNAQHARARSAARATQSR
ncbi:unnamed protein product, partial [Iphiclides podalirius]